MPITEVPARRSIVEPVSLYAERYVRPVSALSPAELEDPFRYLREVFVDFAPTSSVLVFGSGHSYNVNVFHDNFGGAVAAWDFVQEASVGLPESVPFFSNDVLMDSPPPPYDYIFTSHTLEHFTRQQLLTIIVPRLLSLVTKALVVVVPYGDNWADEKTHKCRFFENDELAEMSRVYKRIRGGVELVFWIDKEQPC